MPISVDLGQIAPGTRTDERPGLFALRDSWGRVARDLRISLTDRCNLRCSYCMPPEGLDWLPTEETLTDDEVKRLMRIAVDMLGIREIRFTGGEPMLRKSLPELISFAASLTTDEGKRPDVSMTTNALGLDKKATTLKEAGLQRCNVSLDSVDPEVYASISLRDRHADALRGIDAVIEAGLTPVKVNAVAMRGVNEHGLADLLGYCLDRGIELRIIEHMPLGPRHTWSRKNMVPADEILEILGEKFTLTPESQVPGRKIDPHAPAKRWLVSGPDHPAGTVGIIASVTKPFCGECDRTRLTADGQMRTCLFSRTETDLRGPLRSGASDLDIAKIWTGGMAEKLPSHGINDPSFVQPDRYMSEIGG